MEIKVDSVKPYEKAALPTLQFNVEVEYNKFERVILGVSGYLKSDDGKILSTLNEVSLQEGGEQALFLVFLVLEAHIVIRSLRSIFLIGSYL
jgi:hypothetical protein